MSDVMSHAQWMSLTHGGYTSVRSSGLKAVDNALLKYERTKNAGDKDAVSAALLTWMQPKGNAWKASVRNKNHAVETLYRQLTGTGGVMLSGAERVGLSHIRDESRAIVAELFRGKRLEWRLSFGWPQCGGGSYGAVAGGPGSENAERYVTLATR